MEIKLPKDKHGLRIRHLDAMTDERLSAEAATVSLKIDTIHKFSGISKPRLHSVPESDLTKMFNHLMSIIASMDYKSDPPKEIFIMGRGFTLVDFEKAPAGWHADNEASDYILDPVRLACICYIPTGSYYGEIDQHENLVHPISSRWNLFNEQFPLEVFLQLNAFFLRKFSRSMNAFTVRSLKKIRRRARRAKVNSIGRAFLMLFRKNIA